MASFKATPVFEWNYNSPYRININQGGTSSGKTYAILQVILLTLINNPKKIATVIGQDLPNLKKGAIRDLKDRILSDAPFLNRYIATYNKTEQIFRFNNGSILEFTSFKDEQDAKSGKRDIAFFNEGNGIPFTIYQQVAMRTADKIYIDYNPTAEFWAHEIVMPQKDSITFYSNFTHNPYCAKATIEYLYTLKDRDPEGWKVYGLGKTGDLSETIFTNYTVVPEMPKFLKYRGYGMDFGYITDPSTLIECGLANHNDVYLNETFFGYRMRKSDINDRMIREKVRRNFKIWADSADRRLIDDLYDMKWKIFGADKGPNSIIYGINLLKDYNLHITENSLNILNERKKYRLKKDKLTGKLINEPIDSFNHTWDAIRYWAMMNLKPLSYHKKGVKHRN